MPEKNLSSIKIQPLKTNKLVKETWHHVKNANCRNICKHYTYLLFHFTTGCAEVEKDHTRFGLKRAFTPCEHDNHTLVAHILSKLLKAAYYFTYSGNHKIRSLGENNWSLFNNFRTVLSCARLLSRGHLEINFTRLYIKNSMCPSLLPPYQSSVRHSATSTGQGPVDPSRRSQHFSLSWIFKQLLSLQLQRLKIVGMWVRVSCTCRYSVQRAKRGKQCEQVPTDGHPTHRKRQFYLHKKIMTTYKKLLFCPSRITLKHVSTSQPSFECFFRVLYVTLRYVRVA